MARKSLDSRLDRIMDALLPVGSMERAEYMLPAHLQGMLAKHRTRTARIIAGAEKSEPGGWFAAYVAGDPAAALPDMPKALSDALQLVQPPTITEDMSVVDAAQAWADYALGTSQ